MCDMRWLWRREQSIKTWLRFWAAPATQLFCDGYNLVAHRGQIACSIYCYGVPIFLKANDSVGNAEPHWNTLWCVNYIPWKGPSLIAWGLSSHIFYAQLKATRSNKPLMERNLGPRTYTANESVMEPVTGVQKIFKQRWKLVHSPPMPIY